MSAAGHALAPQHRVHGGPDGGPPLRVDASTNVNPLGPAPGALAAVRAAPRQRYPDPAYAALRERLAAHQGVAPARIAVSAGGSEGIFRLTLAARLAGVQQVAAPQPGYADYAAAAQAAGLPLRHWHDRASLLALAGAEAGTLLWVNDPANPGGAVFEAEAWQTLQQALRPGHWLALDLAYAALRLGPPAEPVALPAALAAQAWQVHTPNKALGLPGVRAGWLQAPAEALPGGGLAGAWAQVQALAPSWVLSAEGEALLGAWCEPATQAWLAGCRPTLAAWRAALVAALQARGWALAPGTAPFVLGRPPGTAEAVMAGLRQLRQRGLALRCCQSFGLPGWVRVGLRPPAEQALWLAAWDAEAAAAAAPPGLGADGRAQPGAAAPACTPAGAMP
ncbi:aminotransferase class I/II-fold pyridoxal phosphate-dependent enzyme [Aquabacterium sp. OR-4]|uniref:aminotransferase class I/II-fold pyridoxal phosphate-dependent enzyme n=1 Tax=Aquabacterium sp. OR-4 TaxID=2978127 RepID=UPI0021B4153D|nr:aminotransferase class I/II-fold pyridoxal phosphate-dependent enzyme [Aquabacterium sp. OR-4]MDT7836119.1 aminotransferase class I/II-fold pyridoxal phosphate-dependent enzyme [Aquabacterium sp. OR-4]